MKSDLVLFDTNMLLDNPEILKDYDNVVFSCIVLQELDKLKYNINIGYASRCAIRGIQDYISSDKKYEFDKNEDSTMSNDMNIIWAAKRHGAKLLTKDIAASIFAESLDVDCELVTDKLITDFSPYIIDNNPEFPFEDFNLKGEDLRRFKQYILEKFKRELTAWTYYIIKKDIYCYNPVKDMLECISKSEEYARLDILGEAELIPKDIYQKAAMYSMMNADATLLVGKWGSGKSLLSVACGLKLAKGKKVFIMRPTLTSKKYDIGFLPGDKSAKMLEFFSGFLSSLSFLYGNTRNQKDEDNCPYDYVKEDLVHNKFEFLSLPELHGLSIQSGDVILVDEVQLLDHSYLCLLLSRICEGAKLIMMGDLRQSLGLLNQTEVGLNKLMKLLPHKSLSVVQLKNVYRNKELSDLADKLFEI